ncbi:transporter substrate-binding domain-containing protein [Pelagicoccus sp. SDUM812002]|uniref:transporter substrate-binding domain-containing protein n=1 Tax=Pelagicoccus sp. SDUM812002 TaxID=3041266 RepID=UPI00280CF911|nr:transporter substrate-binding domain-containing protein [Pelagicoccus sp. SDUM812002]MDQ8184106.1 transporter substrate-binding domain-containing protein [Pelagicoccus sp. SDUM812002]
MVFLRQVSVLAAASVLLFGCGDYPRDARDSLKDAADLGKLKAGYTLHSPWVSEGNAGSSPTGHEARLINEFAGALDLNVEWISGSESQLLEWLEKGEIDLAIGGFPKDLAWKSHAALTFPYFSSTSREVPRVIAVPAGENQLLTTLERYLLEVTEATNR